MTGLSAKQTSASWPRAQLTAARRDPRLERGRKAMVAHFWAAIEEAERVRMLGMWGLEELSQAFDREEARASVSLSDEDIADGATRSLQAAWERAELARAEKANGHPHLNAQALLSMNSALDALVEEFVPAMRDIRRMWMTDEIIRRIEEGVPDVANQLTPERREHLVEVVHAVAAQKDPKLKRLTGSGTARYEALLAQEHLGAPNDRPLSEDLDCALAELGALRDVLTHRAGRVDTRALEQAPSLRYSDGELVRISRSDYRIYSAAIRCYAAEITYRSIRSWPEVSDEEDGPNLAGWRDYRLVNA